jgi:hypothetical protein
MIRYDIGLLVMSDRALFSGYALYMGRSSVIVAYVGPGRGGVALCVVIQSRAKGEVHFAP